MLIKLLILGLIASILIQRCLSAFYTTFRPTRRFYYQKYESQTYKYPSQPYKYQFQPYKYPSQQPNYAIQQPNYAIQQPNYAIQQPNYAIQQPNYVSQQPNYAIQQPNYISQQQKYSPQPYKYPYQQQRYPPEQQKYISRQQRFAPEQQKYASAASQHGERFATGQTMPNWCAITCTDENNDVVPHTMCQFRHDQPAQRCNEVVEEERKLNQSQINLILTYHNKIRGLVSNSPSLVWDPILATVAQRWANQCDYDNHDKCRKLGKTANESVGQNMAFIWNTKKEDNLIQDLMIEWVKEKQFVNQNIIASFPFHSPHIIAHYTQMVWRKTTKIGCGFVKFFEKKFIDNQMWDGYSRFLVCNYGPGGNIIGQAVY